MQPRVISVGESVSRTIVHILHPYATQRFLKDLSKQDHMTCQSSVLILRYPMFLMLLLLIG